MVTSDYKDMYGCGGTAFDDLRDILKELASSFERAAEVEGAEAAKVIRESAQALLIRANTTLDELAKTVGSAKSSAVRGRGHLEESIRKQPLLAVGIAAAAGALLASLRRR